MRQRVMRPNTLNSGLQGTPSCSLLTGDTRDIRRKASGHRRAESSSRGSQEDVCDPLVSSQSRATGTISCQGVCIQEVRCLLGAVGCASPRWAPLASRCCWDMDVPFQERAACERRARVRPLCGTCGQATLLQQTIRQHTIVVGGADARSCARRRGRPFSPQCRSSARCTRSRRRVARLHA